MDCEITYLSHSWNKWNSIFSSFWSVAFPVYTVLSKYYQIKKGFIGGFLCCCICFNFFLSCTSLPSWKFSGKRLFINVYFLLLGRFSEVAYFAFSLTLNKVQCLKKCKGKQEISVRESQYSSATLLAFHFWPPQPILSC